MCLFQIVFRVLFFSSVDELVCVREREMVDYRLISVVSNRGWKLSTVNLKSVGWGCFFYSNLYTLPIVDQLRVRVCARLYHEGLSWL